MDLVIAFLLGLLGSLHCAAMCGPLMLALPATGATPARFIAGRVIYQSGRVMTYALLGVVAGLAGKSLVLAGLQRWFSIALGVAILAGFLAARRMAVGTPVTRLVGILKTAMAVQLKKRNLRSLALLGLLNGLLPCGLAYVAMAGAATQGNLLDSVIYMMAFGLGTWPMMLGISLSGKLLPVAVRFRLRRLIPAGVCALAALLILRGMSLGIPYVSPDLAHGGACCAR
jgi:sulfite exporter TauE/SafE